MVDELVGDLNDDQAHLHNLDLTWGFDLDEFLQERRQQAPATGDAGDGKAETIRSSHGGVVGDSAAPEEKAESETIGSSQGGTVDASLAPGREGRMLPQRSINVRHRPRER